MKTRKRLSAPETEESRDTEYKRKKTKTKQSNKDEHDDNRGKDSGELNESSENHPEEEQGPAEKEEPQEVVQNREETKDIQLDVDSITLKRKPMLILHKLKNLELKIQVLLNNAVLPQKGSIIPSEEEAKKSAEDCESEETSLPDALSENKEESESNQTLEEEETEEKTVNGTEETYELDDANHENEAKANLESDDANCENEAKVNLESDDANCENEAKVNLESDDSSHENEAQASLESDDANCENEATIIDDAPDAVEETTVETEETGYVENVVLILEREEAEESSGPQESLPQNVNCENEEVSMHIDGISHEAEEPDVPKSESVLELPQPLLRPSQEYGLELDAMDLEQLQREKLKRQITVLRLQEAYYSLQLKKLNQGTVQNG